MDHAPRKFSRRDFLRITGAAAAAAVGKHFIDPYLSPPPIDSSKSLPPKPPWKKPEGTPEDVLGPDELKNANVMINQGKETQLYLRRGVLNLPVFKDAADKKIGGLVITLVDRENLSWNAMSQIPSDARDVWQALNSAPSEYSTSYWTDLQTYYQKRLLSDQDSLKFWQTRLEQVKEGGEEEKRYKDDIDLYKDVKTYMPNPEYWQKQIDDMNRRLVELPKKEKEVRELIASSQKTLKKSEKLAEVLQDRQTAINYFAEYDGPQGTFINGRNNADRLKFRLKPENIDKVYIYVAVGGDIKPDPSQSYPSPDQFTIINNPDKTGYDVFSDKIKAGFIMRHEKFHYSSPGGKSHNEHEADHGALQSIATAWDRYKNTGNNQDYVFVFVNDKGITITRENNRSTQNSI